ncbi:ureidoglycolate lyase [Kaistia dalseonensis]|uniref:Ureidoglycolate hydrolase n=1 Tax=Kaistia dalseonensis TaxID=410840 RepID=A0ABU0HG02_9HYPH|nr:ureidoglycolate lyase [Kaistia dalseonensis]MCX5497785.1 ureidoglycolate lyase [Kaistia dalseonensis]MDQ0440429.1 ureidoglycolate hydrolase [Kaistia dalseonensis]
MTTPQATLDVERRPLIAEPITAEAFLPFGRLIEPTEDMVPAGAIDAALDLSGGAPRFYIMRLDYRGYDVNGITRHGDVTQVLASVGGKSWLLCVAPPVGDGDKPDPEAIRAFVIPGDVAVLLYRGSWHAGPYFHDAEMKFFNLELIDTNVVDHFTVNLGRTFGYNFKVIDPAKS